MGAGGDAGGEGQGGRLHLFMVRSKSGLASICAMYAIALEKAEVNVGQVVVVVVMESLQYVVNSGEIAPFSEVMPSASG